MADRIGMLETHEWARLEGKLAVVGITPFAIAQLGDVVFVELPEAGSAVRKGDPFGEIESVKAASELIAPMSGRIAAVNTGLEDNYDAIAEEPYGAGWMIKIEVSDPAEFDTLMSEAQYLATCTE